MADIRILTQDEQEVLEQFLRAHTAEAMILRSNLAQSGITDGAEPYKGRYAAAFEGGRAIAAAAHYWNGMLILCAPDHAAALATAATTGRHVAGVLGPWKQALDAQQALNLDGSDCRLRSHEILMALNLDSLKIPRALLPEQNLQSRLARTEDLDLLTQWREAFRLESMGDTPSQALRQHCQAEMTRWIAEQNQFLLFDGGRPVSGCAFNACLPDAVQIGNVWTPPEFRSRGYARAVVAGALDHARRDGATLAVLFTPEDNAAAIAAYAALGFSPVGEYAMLLFE